MAAADEKVKNSNAFGYYGDADRPQATYGEALKNTDAYANTMKNYGIGSYNQLWLQSGVHLVIGLVSVPLPPCLGWPKGLSKRPLMANPANS